MAAFFARALAELGLTALFHSPRDIKLLITARFIRLFAYGSSTLILASYLSHLGHSDTKIGLFMTLTLVGDVAISFVLTLVADALGRKIILAAGALLMAVSGLVFAFSGSYWLLLLSAICGVISPSGNEIGPFRAIEESIIAQLTSPDDRSDIYAWFSLCSQAGVAFGTFFCGHMVQYMTETLGWSEIGTYRVTFIIYTLLGLGKFVLSIMLGESVEAGSMQKPPRVNTAVASGGKRWYASLLPDISSESRSIVASLSILFALDSLGSGLASRSWLTYFFDKTYAMAANSLGTLFFLASLLAALSMLAASSISKRIGNIRTMVFTHMPSAVFLSLIAIPSLHRTSSSVYWSMIFLVLRSSTASMDSAPRSAFLAAVVLPEERTAVMGWLNVVKTAGQSAGPLVTGVLGSKGLFWVGLVGAGGLKIVYDTGLLVLFVNQRPREEGKVYGRVAGMDEEDACEGELDAFVVDEDGGDLEAVGAEASAKVLR